MVLRVCFGSVMDRITKRNYIEVEVGSKERNYRWKMVPFKKSCHFFCFFVNSFDPSFPFLSFPIFTSTHSSSHHIHTLSLWPLTSILASSTDGRTEREKRSNMHRLDVPLQLEWRNELSRCIQEKSYLCEVILNLWTDEDFGIIDGEIKCW